MDFGLNPARLVVRCGMEETRRCKNDGDYVRSRDLRRGLPKQLCDVVRLWVGQLPVRRSTSGPQTSRVNSCHTASVWQSTQPTSSLTPNRSGGDPPLLSSSRTTGIPRAVSPLQVSVTFYRLSILSVFTQVSLSDQEWSRWRRRPLTVRFNGYNLVAIPYIFRKLAQSLTWRSVVARDSRSYYVRRINRCSLQ